MKPTKRNKLVAALSTTLGLMMAPAAHPAESSAANGAGEETIELSPFVVSSERDTGYQATNTLAGTRLNTPIEDIGAAISIYTKDLMDDIGVTNANELLVYATGMEAAGPMGNFSGVGDDGIPTNEVGRTEPQSQLRARGLAAPSTTRGFFLTDIRFDGYNTDRVTVNRGPNAILFGVGNPAGVVDTTLAYANPGRNKTKIQIRYGNNDSFRSVLDINRVLLEDKLAARLIALYDDKKFTQRPAFEENRRVYGALTFEPFKSTSLRANFETGRTRANRPFTVTPYNAYEEWSRAGRQPFDWTFYDDPTRNPNAQATNASSQIGFLIASVGIGSGSYIFPYSDPSGSDRDAAFRTSLITTTGTIANAVRAGTFNAQVNRDLGHDTPIFWGTRWTSNIPAGWWPGGVAPAGIQRQAFTDYSVFDWRKRMIDESSRQNETFHTFNVAVEQRAWKDRVGIEVAYDRQRNDRHAKNTFFNRGNASNIRIDPNLYLPNGEPNPNVGRPFIAAGDMQWTNNLSEREAIRSTAFLAYDFKDLGDSWGKWLGRHVATGLYERSTFDSMRPIVRLALDGPAMSGPINNGSRRLWPLVYLGPSVVGNNNPVRLEPVSIPELVAGPTDSVPVFVREAGTTDPGHYEMMPMSLVEVLNSGTAQREVIESQAVSLQSYWLRDHLVTLAGWRRDEDYFQQVNLPSLRNPADNTDPGKVYFGFDEFGFADTPPINAQGEIITYGAVLKWPKSLVKLPAGVDLSVFYNESENFAPLSGLVDAFNNPLESPRGETREYGFNFSAFNRKLTVRLNRFETNIVGQILAGTPYRNVSHANVVQRVQRWATEANRNPGNVPFMDAAIARLLSPLPPDYMQLRDYTVTGTAPTLSTSINELAGLSDTTDFTAKGTEIDIVFNPTRNWRILANIANQETVRNNIIPLTQEFYALMQPAWDSSVTDPVSGVTVAMRDIPVSGYPVGFGPANPPSNVNSVGDVLLTQVEVFMANQLANEGSVSPEQRKWRVNLVTNYDFGRDSILGEKLNGWSIGGAIRWQSKQAIGYPISFGAVGDVVVDVANPYYGPAESNVDAWIGYKRKIRNDRINWKVQLNGANVIGGNGLKAIRAQPWGEAAQVRIPPERRWFVTNTFEF